MGIKLVNFEGKDLYVFWDDCIIYMLNKVLEEQGDNVLINFVLNEYFKVVKKKFLDGMIIMLMFKDCKNGQYKIISFFVKKVCGLMVCYIFENCVEDV